jgi:CYTH domain-containing protein
MALEIERKFLVKRDRLPALTDPTLIRQAYIPTANGTTVRVRLAGEQGMLAVKTKAVGLTRHEYEFPIPAADAREMFEKVCGTKLVEKQRYLVSHSGMTWEIDIFLGSNDGLVVAEIELTGEDQAIDLPDWAADEVTHDPRYSNFSLATAPYCGWDQQ